MKNDYQVIQKIGKNVTDTMLLPCVNACYKDEENNLFYDVSVKNYDECGGKARQGDLLCLGRDGLWYLEKGGEE